MKLIIKDNAGDTGLTIDVGNVLSVLQQKKFIYIYGNATHALGIDKNGNLGSVVQKYFIRFRTAADARAFFDKYGQDLQTYAFDDYPEVLVYEGQVCEVGEYCYIDCENSCADVDVDDLPF